MDDFYPSINGVIQVMDNYARRLSKIADVVIVVPEVNKNYIDNFPYKVIRIKSHPLRIADYHVANILLSRKEEKMLFQRNLRPVLLFRLQRHCSCRQVPTPLPDCYRVPLRTRAWHQVSTDYSNTYRRHVCGREFRLRLKQSNF